VSKLHTLLNNLEFVQEKTAGRYRAKCPVHGGDSHDSLGIKECEDGRLLIYCYAYQCSPAEIMAACGLEMTDLYPERLTHHATPQERVRWRHDAQHRDWMNSAGAVLREARVVWVAGNDILNGNALNDNDIDRLRLSLERLEKEGNKLSDT
jgi:hypothetical protein